MGATSNASSSSSARTGISTTAAAVRLKREDYTRTKHDPAFSQWKILIGPSDWKDHRNGEEGAEMYRTQNLPIPYPGVYELGIVPFPRPDRGARKLESSSILPVYLGMAENVRARLQQYGRDGTHLENGPQLFKETFSQGCAIAYRFTPMESQMDAELTEKQLLDTFDYAWNKIRNGDRRNIFEKLCHHATKASLFSWLSKKLLSFPQKKVGIRIRTCEPFFEKNLSNEPNMKNNTMFSKAFGFKRLYPIPPPVAQIQFDGEYDICGVVIGDGLTCIAPPVKGRKRCAEHKGMRVNSYISKLNAEAKSPPVFGLNAEGKSPPICGFIMEDGSPCNKSPLNRNKRCLEHKGRRIR